MRVGRDGREFRIYKFRTMYIDAEARLAELRHLNEHDGVLFKIRNDPRVTPVGRWLRRYSLDELPQLFNVVSGQMSLVGPRPPLPHEVAAYADDVRRRLAVKPGMTGYGRCPAVRTCRGRSGPVGPALRGELVAVPGPGHPAADADRGDPQLGSVLMAPASDGGLRRWLAGQAGELLLELRETMGFDDRDALRHAGDKQSHELLRDRAGALAPGRRGAVRGGRLEDNPIRLDARERVWIIDPLDGTREFAEAGRSDWAVHVALWSRRTAADAWSPARSRCPPGAGCWPPTCRRRTRRCPRPPPPAARSGSRPAAPARRRSCPRWPSEVGAELVPMGSAGREDRGGDHRRGRRVRARRRPVRVGLGRAGGCGAGHGPARFPDRRHLRWNTTRPNPCCPTCWSAGRISRPGCCRQCHSTVDPAGAARVTLIPIKELGKVWK